MNHHKTTERCFMICREDSQFASYTPAMQSAGRSVAKEEYWGRGSVMQDYLYWHWTLFKMNQAEMEVQQLKKKEKCVQPKIQFRFK